MSELAGKRLQGEVEISFGSNLGFVDLIEELSRKVCLLAGFDEDTVLWIGLSVRECVVNAIRHGHKLDNRKRVVIRFSICPDRVLISILDQGVGFQDSAVPDPLDPKNLSKTTGRGLFYARTLMDEVGFHTFPGGGFEIRMEKRLNVP